MPPTETPNLPAEVPVHGTSLPLQVAGELIALKPVVEHFGLNAAAQLRKLKEKSWAVVAEMATTGADGKLYMMSGVDRRTLTMWLATLSETRVRPELRAELIAYQREASTALDNYFHRGVAVNQRAATGAGAEDHASRLLSLELLKAAHETGLLSRDHLAARAEIIVARGLGELPAIPAAARPIYVQDYLRDKGLPPKIVKAYRSQFGKDARAAYAAKHGGADPKKADVLLENGRVREANAYTGADADVLDAAWSAFISRHPEFAHNK